MECEVFKKRYRNLLSEESRLERCNNLENLIKEGINQLPKEHAAYFLCEISLLSKLPQIGEITLENIAYLD